MYRLLSVFVLAIILLVGCQANASDSSDDLPNKLSENPEAALKQINLEADYAKPMEIYKTVKITEGKIMAIYKGLMNDDEDIYIVEISKKDDKWYVSNAINIGMPSADK